MISADDIATFFQDPDSIRQSSVSDLKDLTEKYPYCSSLHILYLKGLSIHQGIGFEEVLQRSAAHVFDREHLHSIILGTETASESTPLPETEPKETTTTTTFSEEEKENQEELEIKEAAVVQAEVEIQEEEVVLTNDTLLLAADSDDRSVEMKTDLEQDIIKELADPIHEIVPEENSEQISKKETVLDTSAETSEEEQNDLETVKAKETSPILPSDTDDYPQKAVDDLDQDIRTEAISANYELATDDSPEQIPDTEIEAEVPSPTLEIKQKEEEDSHESTTAVVEEKAQIDYDNLSFTQWLKLKQGRPIDEEEEVYFESKEEDEDLVDKFIREEPSISRPEKKAFYDPVQNAKESLIENTEIVSETLAEVHIQQKNFGKAIETYEQLMSVYPEKKAIFATRIEEINARLR